MYPLLSGNWSGTATGVSTSPPSPPHCRLRYDANGQNLSYFYSSFVVFNSNEKVVYIVLAYRLSLSLKLLTRRQRHCRMHASNHVCAIYRSRWYTAASGLDVERGEKRETKSDTLLPRQTRRGLVIAPAATRSPSYFIQHAYTCTQEALLESSFVTAKRVNHAAPHYDVTEICWRYVTWTMRWRRGGFVLQILILPMRQSHATILC